MVNWLEFWILVLENVDDYVTVVLALLESEQKRHELRCVREYTIDQAYVLRISRKCLGDTENRRQKPKQLYDYNRDLGANGDCSVLSFE